MTIRTHPTMRTSFLGVIDPGVRKAGLAIFENGNLIYAATVTGVPDVVRALPPIVDRVVRAYAAAHSFAPPPGAPPKIDWVVEKMVAYESRSATHADLERVEAVTKALRKVLGVASWSTVKPAEWKRSVPKDICRKRAMKLLPFDELRAFQDHGHDAWDAAMLGLVHLGRAKAGVLGAPVTTNEAVADGKETT